ncbi:MAG: hypothetical protein FJ319_01025 [SAR202 cluster bacterium]|nr:hypothetical protein [SAR202 cluster bacterium]
MSVAGASISSVEPTILDNIIGFLANPNIAFLLFVIGGVAIIIEIATPGLIGPGIVGGICIALGLVGFGNLPVNWIAVGLLVFAMVLFYLEVHIDGHTVLGVGGVVALVLGGLLLFGGYFSAPDFPEPSLRVSLWIIGAMAAIALTTFAVFFRFARQDVGSNTGNIDPSELEIIGEWGISLTDLRPSGKVMVNGREYVAAADYTEGFIPKDEHIQVTGVYRDVLKVERMVKEPRLPQGKP